MNKERIGQVAQEARRIERELMAGFNLYDASEPKSMRSAGALLRETLAELPNLANALAVLAEELGEE
jgi:hypothetical protein